MQLLHRRAPAERGTRGQALVEFALVFPVFVLLLAGMIDFGMGLFAYMTTINAARDGARLAVTNCTAGPCEASVRARTLAAAGNLNPTVTITCAKTNADGSTGASVNCSTGTALSGDNATVTVSYTYRMVWPLTFGTQIPMTSSVRMILE